MRILHIISGLSLGGAERMLFNILSGGLAERFKCMVVSLKDEGYFGQSIHRLGIPMHSLGLRRGISVPGSVHKLQRLMLAFRPDVVQGWMYHGNLAATLARSMARKRPALAWNIRQSLYGVEGEKSMTRQVIRANRMLSSRPESILYNSHASRLQHEAFGFYSARGFVIPNGFDMDRLGPSTDVRRQVRASFGIPVDSRVVGHVARLHPMKDHENFVLAAVRIANEFDNVHFLLAGRDVTRDNESLLSIVPDSIQSRFHWLGERTDVEDLMRAMDVFVLSSWGEGFPNVLGEAMACGVTCVTTDVGDSARLLNGYGRIVAPQDSVSLAEAVSELLRLDSYERIELGVAARLHIEANFSISVIADEYIALYEGIADSA